MNQLAQIGERDGAALCEVVELSYRLARVMDLSVLAGTGTRTPENIGISGVCAEMSDIATRTAHNLGILASREAHPNHYLTSFAPLEAFPAEDDLILCFTSGQFNVKAISSGSTVYFGKRKDIKDRVGPSYRNAYDSRSTVWRQTAYTRPLVFGRPYAWLNTTAEEVAAGEVPIGFVDRTEYPDSHWDERYVKLA